MLLGTSAAYYMNNTWHLKIMIDKDVCFLGKMDSITCMSCNTIIQCTPSDWASINALI